jgi:hypothetical protein
MRFEWLAGGGKPGISGQTDEFGYSSFVDRVSAHDLNATALRLWVSITKIRGPSSGVGLSG